MEVIYIILSIEHIVFEHVHADMINIALHLLEMHRNMTDDDTRMQDQEQGEDSIIKGKV